MLPFPFIKIDQKPTLPESENFSHGHIFDILNVCFPIPFDLISISDQLMD